ncbi:fimbrillin family protein [Phocaeicola dorei]|jgi:hypothetical protein|uniref:fimbrillin family protein n=1 Tax=Phocaeicola dorei TaxID=357276 RepID=UPI000336579B|nr:fimbrillin family protein [Phocaeicola dorei]MCE8447126.1 fimbrillin family protein [Phocaeicola dorei]CDB38240.1 putative uncharacterized protein [Phocaeicola dorei CAG:222]DAY46759.1 MAG TPA: Fimbrillin-like [Caudoviricetes sp.]
MKRRLLRHKFALWVIAALALASCSQDELADGGQGTPLPPGEYPLTLTASSIGETVATPATRGTVDNEWDGTEYVCVQVYDNYTSGEPQWSNATEQEYKVTKDGTMTKTSGNDVYWQTSGEKKAIRACFVAQDPYDPVPPPSSHAVNADQSWNSEYYKSDLLYAGCISGFAEGKDGINLTFYHQVAKLTIQIVRGKDTPAVFSVTGLKINRVATKGDFTAPATFVDDDDSRYGRWSNTTEVKDITPHETTADYPDNSGILAAYEAIVIPQTVKANTKLFTITAEGYSDFAYTTTAEKEWEPGKEYTYTITIKGDRLEVSVSGGNIGWGTDGATGSGEVELP